MFNMLLHVFDMRVDYYILKNLMECLDWQELVINRDEDLPLFMIFY